MNDIPTPETDDFEDGCINPAAFADFARKLERERDQARRMWSIHQDKLAELREQVRLAIIENLHLADGDVCTLKRLKDAIVFELPPENATSPSVDATEKPMPTPTDCRECGRPHYGADGMLLCDECVSAALDPADATICSRSLTPETDEFCAQYSHHFPNWLAGEFLALARRLERELDAAIAVIEAIKERYIDSSDIYSDFEFMGENAREFLSENAQAMAPAGEKTKPTKPNV